MRIALFTALLVAVAAPSARAQSQEMENDPCRQTQERIVQADPDTQLRSRLGDGYAGVWMDRRVCRFAVGVAPATDRAVVEQVLTERGIRDITDVWDVRWTYRELTEAQELLSARLQEHFRHAVVMTGIGLSGHELLVHLRLCDCATPEQQRTAEQAAAENPTQVVVERRPAADFVIGPNIAAPSPLQILGRTGISRRTLLGRGVRVVVHGRPGAVVSAELVARGRRLARRRATIGADGSARVTLRPRRAARRLEVRVSIDGKLLPERGVVTIRGAA